MSAATHLPHLMTVAEFLACDPPAGTDSDRWELRDGHPSAIAILRAERDALLGIPPTRNDVRRTASEPRTGWRRLTADDRQSEGIEPRGIDRDVTRRGDRFLPRTRQLLLEVQLYYGCEHTGCEQGVAQAR